MPNSPPQLRRGTRAKRPNARYEQAESQKRKLDEEVEKPEAEDGDVDNSEAESQGDASEDDGVYCVCRKGNDGSPMICCARCDEWYHFKCIGLTKRSAKDITEYVLSLIHI